MFGKTEVNVNGLVQKWPEINRMLDKGGHKLLATEMTYNMDLDQFLLLLKYFPSGRTKFATAKNNLFVLAEVDIYM